MSESPHEAYNKARSQAYQAYKNAIAQAYEAYEKAVASAYEATCGQPWSFYRHKLEGSE